MVYKVGSAVSLLLSVENCSFEPDTRRTDGTYGKYSSIDDKFDALHYFCHYIKFGIGRTRLDASQEIRNGHIDREEAIMLAQRFEGEFPSRYFKDCLDFLGISEKYFGKKLINLDHHTYGLVKMENGSCIKS